LNLNRPTETNQIKTRQTEKKSTMKFLLYIAFATIASCSPVANPQINVVVPRVVGQHTVHTTLDPETVRNVDVRQRQEVVKGFGVVDKQPLQVDVVVEVRGEDATEGNSKFFI